MKLLFLLAFLSGLGSFVLAQSSTSSLHPAQLVQKAHQSGSEFIETDQLFSPRSSSDRARSQRASVLRNEVLLDLNPNQAKRLVSQSPEAISMRMPLPDGGETQLELIRVDLFADDFFVNGNYAPDGIPYTPGQHYRGVVAGHPGSLAAVSIFPDQVMGIFSTLEEGNFILGQLGDDSPARQHVLYREKDLIPAMPFSCETGDGDPVPPMESLQRVTTNPCVKVYLEVDSSLTDYHGSVTAATNFATGVFNQSATIYAMESIDYTISQIFVWQGPSPYYTSSPSNLLDIFKSRISTLNGDLGHLFTMSTSGGVAAGQNGLCNSNPDNSLCVSDVFGTYQTVPTYSWSVNVVTHEMGHLNGSPHTHSCSWNGNQTAIDGCADTTHGGCPIPPYPSGGGTIMSYCHNRSPGINFSLGFGQQPGDRIRAVANNAPCLTSCSPPPPTPLVCNQILNTFPYAESFETGFGWWGNETGDDFDWQRDTYGTLTSGTGPSQASDGLWYAFIDATGHTPDQEAVLISPCLVLDNKQSASFGFDYNMNGIGIGKLDLEASKGNGDPWTSIWSRTGDQGSGNPWYSATVDLAQYLGDTVQLRLKASTTNLHYGDIAVDNISIVAVDSTAPGPDLCYGNSRTFHYSSFESGMDDWTITTATNTWRRQYKYWVNPGRYPTSGSNGLYFMFLDAGDEGKRGFFPGYISYLEGPCYIPTPGNPALFEFDFHMYGADIGDLEVEVSTNHGATWNQVWTQSGNQGNSWLSSSISLSGYLGDTCRIRFKGITGSGPSSNIAIDNFRFNYSINGPLGEDKLTASTRIVMYPNPAREWVNLEVDQEKDGPIEVTVTDVVGRILIRKSWPGAAGGNKQRLLTGSLAAGTYFVAIQVGGSKVVKRLLVE